MFILDKILWNLNIKTKDIFAQSLSCNELYCHIDCHQLLLQLSGSPVVQQFSMQILLSGGDSSCSWALVRALGHN